MDIQGVGRMSINALSTLSHRHLLSFRHCPLSVMEGDALPVCFAIPPDPQAPPQKPRGKHQLHGADDLISLFNLKSLWERSVKPYAAIPRTKQKDQVNADQDVGNSSAVSVREGEADTKKPMVMEKTYVNYVRDLPGQVRPPRRTVSKYSTALAAASSSGAPMPALPPEVTGQTTMREIVFRPETTMQRIAPFDDESLRAAFTVEAGPVPDIDMSLLESDEVAKQSPQKRKKKRKHQRDNTGNTDEASLAKKSKLNTSARR